MFSYTSPAGIKLSKGAGQGMLLCLLAGNGFLLLNARQRWCEEKRLLLAKVSINRMSYSGKDGHQNFLTTVNYAE